MERFNAELAHPTRVYALSTRVPAFAIRLSMRAMFVRMIDVAQSLRDAYDNRKT